MTSFQKYSRAGLEQLELRAMLAADSSLQNCWHDSADYWDSDLDSLSLRSLLSSCGDGSGASGESPLDTASFDTLAATGGDEGAVNGDPPLAPPLATAMTSSAVADPFITGIVARFSLAIQDMSGNAITTKVDVGQQFKLVAFVRDIRDPVAANPGVAAAFMNVVYNSSLVSIASLPPVNDPNDVGNNADPGIEWGPFFDDGLRFGDLSVPGQITGAGAASFEFSTSGTGDVLLWKITARATSAGTVTFTPSFDANPSHESSFLIPADAFTADNIDFDPVSLVIEAPTVSITPTVSQNEGNTGTSPATPYVFTVNLSQASTQAVTVAFATAPGTAGAGDFTGQSGTLTFTPGQTSKLVTISVAGDTDPESDETFSVSLSSPTNATLAAVATGVGTIVNDDSIVLGITGVSQVETNAVNNMVFTVTISQPSSSPVLVPFQTVDGTATSTGPSADYTPTSGTLTFAAGIGTPQLITVAINGEATVEQNETFRLVLTQPENTVFDSSQGEATGTLLNDDGAVISFVQQNVAVTEGDSGTTAVVFSVSVSVETEVPITVAFSTGNGTATTAGNDYTGTSGTLTFNSEGSLTQLVTVLVNGDELPEADETFFLNLANATNATISQSTGTATIENDDPLPTLGFAASPVTVTEGNSGTTSMVFTVNLSEASGQTVTVQFATVNGTATTADSDYQSATGTLTFAPGTTQALVTVAINGDTKDEPSESFTLELSNAAGAGNATGENKVTATGTIEDNDPPPSLNIEDVTHTEADDVNRTYWFTVTLSAASGHVITVPFSTSDGTATSATNDYIPTSGTLTFAPGETLKTITVLSPGDLLHEQDETFNVNLTASPNVTLTRTSAVGTIQNDEAEPSLGVTGGGAKSEGNTGTTNYVFTVSLNLPSGQTVVVDFTTTDGTATATNNDFVGQSGKLTFAPQQTSQLVTVAVNGDTRNEADEAFSLVISNPVNARLGSGPTGNPFAEGLILNDDALPSISINDVTLSEGNSGTTNFVFQVTLSELSGQNVTVAFSTANGTATSAGNDYTATSGTLTFAPGVGTQNITVQVKGDQFDEPNETFFVNLTSPTNATLADAQGLGTINDEVTDNITFTPSTIGGKFFIDVDDSNSFKTGEQVLSGRTVRLSGTSSITNAAVTRNTTTNASGDYSFGDLEPGTYNVVVDQPSGYMPVEVLPGSGSTKLTGNQIGFRQVIGSLGGVTSTNNHFAVLGQTPQTISMRPFVGSFLAQRFSAASTLSAVATPQVSALTASAAAQAHDDAGAGNAAPAVSALVASAAAQAEPQITQTGSHVSVTGTAGDDVIEFEAGPTHTLRVNGVARQFAAESVSSFSLEGGGGQDLVTLTGTTGAETAELGVGVGTLSGANFLVTVNQVSSLTVNGNGGRDAATLHDTALDDLLTAQGDELTITNQLDAATRLLAFAVVEAISSNGGTDSADVDSIDFTLEQQGSWLAL